MDSAAFEAVADDETAHTKSAISQQRQPGNHGKTEKSTSVAGGHCFLLFLRRFVTQFFVCWFHLAMCFSVVSCRRAGCIGGNSDLGHRRCQCRDQTAAAQERPTWPSVRRKQTSAAFACQVHSREPLMLPSSRQFVLASPQRRPSMRCQMAPSVFAEPLL